MRPSSVSGLSRRVSSASLASWRSGELGETEIEQLDLAVIRDHDVARFEIAMDDAGCVRAGQGVGDGDRILQNLGRLQAAARDDMVERAAGDELHHDEVGAILAADVVNGDDVGMIQGGGGLGFLDEAQLAVGVGDLVGRQNLDRDKAVQLRIAGLVDDAHTALAQLLDDLVVRNGPADHGAVSPPSLLQELDPGNHSLSPARCHLISHDLQFRAASPCILHT